MIVEPMVQRGLPRKDSINPLSKKQNLGILTFYNVRLFNDFSLIWRYFAWTQLIIATLVLFTATVYLIKKEQQYLITFIPTLFCTLLSFGYILQAPEGLSLPSMTANIISIILTAVVGVIFLKKYKR